jgi:hypothetical protein
MNTISTLVLSPSHPDVLPTAADGVGPLRPGPTRRHPPGVIVAMRRCVNGHWFMGDRSRLLTRTGREKCWPCWFKKPLEATR